MRDQRLDARIARHYAGSLLAQGTQMPPPPKVFAPRKLLAAALGVATIQYVGSACNSETSGNLMAPDMRLVLDAGEDAKDDADANVGDADAKDDADANVGDAGDAGQDAQDSGDAG